MSEFEGHTPGPWRTDADEPGEGFLVWAADAGSNAGYPIAEAKRYIPSAGRTKAACTANARLIAAAPTLLRERDEARAERDALAKRIASMEAQAEYDAAVLWRKSVARLAKRVRAAAKHISHE